MKSFIKSLLSRCYYWLKYPNVVIKSGAFVGRNSHFEGYNKIGRNTIFAGSMGFASFIGEGGNFTADIGRFCSIGARVQGIAFRHPSRTFVSSHPAFYSLLKQSGFTYVKEQRFNEYNYIDQKKKITFKVGNDVWIGSDVIIMGGCEIGDGAIVAAGAVVTKDVEPYSVVGGVPARKIRMRFDEETVKFLIKLRWWDKPEEWIKENVFMFENIDIFKNKLMR